MIACVSHLGCRWLGGKLHLHVRCMQYALVLALSREHGPHYA